MPLDGCGPQGWCSSEQGLGVGQGGVERPTWWSQLPEAPRLQEALDSLFIH